MLRNFRTCALAFLASLFVVVETLSAQTAPVNLLVAPGNNLVSFDAGGTTYTPAELIQPTLAAFTGGSTTNIIVQNGGAVPPFGSRSPLLVTDFSLDTGVINSSTNVAQNVLSFPTGLTNGPGPELVMFEINPGATPDSFAVQVNGNTVVYPGASYNIAVGSVTSLDLYARSGGTPADLTQLETGTYTLNNNNISQNLFGIAIDLNDFGVAPNAIVGNVNYASSGATFDPMLFMGIDTAPPAVPEPSTFLLGLIALAGFGLIASRRRTALRRSVLTVAGALATLCLAGTAIAVPVSLTTNDGLGADAYVQGTNGATTNFGSDTELRVKYEANGASFNRKTYLRFDLSSAPGDIVANSQLDISVLNPPTLGTDGGLNWNFNVFGLNDGVPGEGWSEAGINWNNAPANDTSIGNGVTADATFLGNLSPTITGRGAGGQILSLTGPALDGFLSSDTNDLATLIITRVETQPNGANTVVHIFESKEAFVNAAPTLSFDSTSAVPEPSTFVLVILGLFGFLMLGWRRRSHVSAASVLAVLSLAFMATDDADAAPFLYEGFPAGGATPTAIQYQSDPDSTNGVDNDSIRNQGPASGIGFNGGDNWAGDPVAAVVYPRVLDSGLNYTDNFANNLVTTQGAVDWHRGNSTSVFTKRESRDTNLSPSLPNVGYFSALLQFTPGTFGQVELLQADGGGGSSRSLFFGFNSSGEATAGTSPGPTVTGPSVFAPNTPYLLFGEVTNDATADDLRLWVNPADLSNPTAGAPEIVSANIGSGWVGGNPAFTIRELSVFANTTQFSQFVFDEIRVGNTPSDVLPFAAAAVPEPSTFVLGALALMSICLLGWRRR